MAQTWAVVDLSDPDAPRASGATGRYGVVRHRKRMQGKPWYCSSHTSKKEAELEASERHRLTESASAAASQEHSLSNQLCRLECLRADLARQEALYQRSLRAHAVEAIERAIRMGEAEADFLRMLGSFLQKLGQEPADTQAIFERLWTAAAEEVPGTLGNGAARENGGRR